MNNKTFWAWIVGVLVVVVLIVILVRVSAFSKRDNELNSKDNSSNTAINLPDSADSSGTPASNLPIPNPSPNPNPTPVPPSNNPPPTQFSAPIAYIGCSNTWMYVDGYHRLGGTKLWPDQYSYSGQVITRWSADISSNSGGWRAFDSANVSQPGAKALWILPCAFSYEKESDVYSSLVNVIKEAKSRIPTIQNVYLSGLNSFENCTLARTVGVESSDSAVTQAVQNGYGLQGPTFAHLSVAETASNGCHPLVGAPRNKEGQVLLNFFK